MGLFIFVAAFVTFTGVNGIRIDVNPDKVISILPRRDPKNDYIHPDIKCLIHTSDGRFTGVMEDCPTVLRKLQE